MWRVAIALGKFPDDVEDNLTEEEIMEFTVMENLELRRFTKIDYYQAQLAATVASGHSGERVNMKDYFIPEEETPVPRGWLDLRPEADPEQVKRGVMMAFGIKPTKEND